MTNKKCTICDIEFTCNIERGVGSCWCGDFPAIVPVGFKQDCLCQSCLAKVIDRRIEETIKEKGYKQMPGIAARYRNADALYEHLDYTIEQGYYVFSKWYLLKRGTCCGNGCRNCPYPARKGV